MQGRAVYFCGLEKGTLMSCFEPGTETSGYTEGEGLLRQQFLISYSYR